MTTQLKEHIQVLEARIQCLIDAMLAKYEKEYQVGGIEFEIVKGTKYYKLIEKSTRASGMGGTSVHAFIDRQSGSVMKPASWKSPAKHVRYNLMDDVSYAECLERCDWAGVYLYLK